APARHNVSQFQQDAGLKGDNRPNGYKMESGTVIAILPCNDLDVSERFYSRLGFTRIKTATSDQFPTYRMLSNGNGQLHLTTTVEGLGHSGKKSVRTLFLHGGCGCLGKGIPG